MSNREKRALRRRQASLAARESRDHSRFKTLLCVVAVIAGVVWACVLWVAFHA